MMLQYQYFCHFASTAPLSKATKSSHFEILGLTSAGYSNKVIFPLKIKLDNIDKDSLVALKIIYLVCKDSSETRLWQVKTIY
mgnify:CR=1 FL=1